MVWWAVLVFVPYRDLRHSRARYTQPVHQHHECNHSTQGNVRITRARGVKHKTLYRTHSSVTDTRAATESRRRAGSADGDCRRRYHAVIPTVGFNSDGNVRVLAIP